MSSAYAGSVAFDKSIRKKIADGEAVFCLFSVYEKQTEKELFFGQKFRVVSDLVYVGKLDRPFKRIYEYITEMQVCGVECEVLYWVGDSPRKPQICATAEGEMLLENYGLKI